MNREQCEAKILETMQPCAVGSVYVLPREVLLSIIHNAWKAGNNDGFREGGKHVIATYDAALGRGR